MTQLSKRISTPTFCAPKMAFTNRMFQCMFLGLSMLCLLFATVPANAACGMLDKPLKPMAWNPQTRAMLPRSDAFGQNGQMDPIVGMWHVVFQAQTMNGSPVTSFVLDNSVVVWHNDGTEIMNSSRPAQDGNFCLGVWEHTGPRQYLLNHIPWAGNDPSNAPSGIGNPQGGVQIIENVTLNNEGNSYTGTFTLRTYDTFGNPGVWFGGVLAATRITPSTSITTLF